MNKYTLSVLAQFILLTFCFGQKAAPIIIHTPSYDSIQYAINLDGNKLFELPAQHKIIIDKSKEDRGDILFEYVYLYDKNRGALVVLGDKEFYLVDEKGNKIAEIPAKFGAVNSAWEGFYRARIKKGNRKEKAKYQYLNSKGEIVFNSKEFLNASHFSEGKAMVQNLDLSWEIIDSKGQSISIIDESFGQTIKRAGHFYNGLCLIQVLEDKPELSSRPVTKYYYINSKGEKTIDANEKFGFFNHFPPSPFHNGAAFFQTSDEIIFFDTLGVEIQRHGNISNVMNREGDYIQLYDKSAKRKIVDRKGNELVIPRKDSEQIIPDKIFGKHLKVYFTDRSTYKRGYKYVDLSTLTTACESNSKVIHVIPNRLVTGSKENPNDLYILKDMEGNILFKNKRM